MAYLHFADGSNGGGITDVQELLSFLEGSPLAFFDFSFIRSYLPLLAPRRLQVLQCFDRATSGRKLQRSLSRIAARSGVRARPRSVIRETQANLDLLMQLAEVLS